MDAAERQRCYAATILLELEALKQLDPKNLGELRRIQNLMNEISKDAKKLALATLGVE